MPSSSTGQTKVRISEIVKLMRILVRMTDDRGLETFRSKRSAISHLGQIDVSGFYPSQPLRSAVIWITLRESIVPIEF